MSGNFPCPLTPRRLVVSGLLFKPLRGWWEWQACWSTPGASPVSMRLTELYPQAAGLCIPCIDFGKVFILTVLKFLIHKYQISVLIFLNFFQSGFVIFSACYLCKSRHFTLSDATLGTFLEHATWSCFTSFTILVPFTSCLILNYSVTMVLEVARTDMSCFRS